MISYIVQGILGNVVNLEFNSPSCKETRKGAHQGHVGSQFLVRTANVLYGYTTISLYVQRGKIWFKNWTPRAFECLWWTWSEPFSLIIFFSLFPFFWGLFNFLSCRVGAYFIATILQVIEYGDFCTWCKEIWENLSCR